MPNEITPPGTRFGRIVTLEPSTRVMNKLLCRCDCGTEKMIRLQHLMQGRIKSCGCLMAINHVPAGTRFGLLVTLVDGTQAHQRVPCTCDCGKTKEFTVSWLTYRHLKKRTSQPVHCGCLMIKHGLSAAKPPEYGVWQAMVQRCTNPNNQAFHCYGGRGITVCNRWREFLTFYADMGQRPSAEHSIDRINNDGNYEPGNCRWATREVQDQNTSRIRRLEVNGITRTIAEWSKATGMPRSAIWSRLNMGWTAEEVITRPYFADRSLSAKQMWVVRKRKQSTRLKENEDARH